MHLTASTLNFNRNISKAKELRTYVYMKSVLVLGVRKPPKVFKCISDTQTLYIYSVEKYQTDEEIQSIKSDLWSILY